MEINDKYIKEAVLKYQATQENFLPILEHLSLFIYYFPKLLSNYVKEDMFGDYYDYLIIRLPKILLSYTPMHSALFKTWFYLVQKRHYLNFLKMYNKSKPEDPHEYMDIFSAVSLETSSELELLEVLYKEASSDEILFCKLFSPESLNHVDFLALVEMLKCDMATLLERVRILFNYEHSYEGKKAVKLISVNKVAEFLDWSPLKVSKKLNRIREKMKKTYSWEE